MQFGSSSSAVFFKMRVGGVLHVFQFETKVRQVWKLYRPAAGPFVSPLTLQAVLQGEEICLALTTHINDVMHRRYARRGMGVPAQQQEGGELAGSMPAVEEAPPPPAVPEIRSPGVSAATYERTLQELSDSLQKANSKIELVRLRPLLCGFLLNVRGLTWPGGMRSVDGDAGGEGQL